MRAREGRRRIERRGERLRVEPDEDDPIHFGGRPARDADSGGVLAAVGHVDVETVGVVQPAVVGAAYAVAFHGAPVTEVRAHVPAESIKDPDLPGSAVGRVGPPECDEVAIEVVQGHGGARREVSGPSDLVPATRDAFLR